MITYQVFPMGHNFGLMEFIKNVSSLNDILKPMHQEDEISHGELRKRMDASYKANKMIELRVKNLTKCVNWSLLDSTSFSVSPSYHQKVGTRPKKLMQCP